MSDIKTDQLILGELRSAHRKLDDISLAMRIDTTWVRIQGQVQYALNVVQQIPFMARFCLVCGVTTISLAAMIKQPRLLAIGLDLLTLSLLFVNGE